MNIGPCQDDVTFTKGIVNGKLFLCSVRWTDHKFCIPVTSNLMDYSPNSRKHWLYRAFAALFTDLRINTSKSLFSGLANQVHMLLSSFTKLWARSPLQTVDINLKTRLCTLLWSFVIVLMILLCYDTYNPTLLWYLWSYFVMILMILWFQGHEASESCFSPNMRIMILLTHFMLSVSFYFPGKQKKSYFFLRK